MLFKNLPNGTLDKITKINNNPSIIKNIYIASIGIKKIPTIKSIIAIILILGSSL
jgi:hypothetical protein